MVGPAGAVAFCLDHDTKYSVQSPCLCMAKPPSPLLRWVSSPSSVRPCHDRTPLVRPRLLTTVHEELNITGLDLIIPGVISPPSAWRRRPGSPLPGGASPALSSRAAEVASPTPGRSPAGVVSWSRPRVGWTGDLSRLCSERLRRSRIPLSHTVAAIAPKLLESHHCCSWPPNLDAECQCHAKHHDALYLHRCSESRVFQIRAKKESSWSPKLCTESKV